MLLPLIIVSVIALSAIIVAFWAWHALATKREECARLQERLLASQTTEQQRIEQAKIDNERFRLLANDLIAAHTSTFRAQNESRLAEILTPLREDIDKFSAAVTNCYNSEARERFSLKERIRELVELNQTIGREAHELSTALRYNNRQQGLWGEILLESILEKAGLRKGFEFTVQDSGTSAGGSSITNDDGRRLRPDVIVHYPDQRVVIIDSKVSLTNFVEYANASDSSQRKHFGQLHIDSVMRHVNELSDKAYQDYMGRSKAEFVLMFIPTEAAYLAAMNLDPALWQKAYDRRVVIVSPTHLMSSLKLIAQLWAHDRQTRNAIEIAEMSGKMYDKFVAFAEDMAKIERGINSASAAYSAAMTKLQNGSGSLVARAQKLRQMGIKTSKQLPYDAHDQSSDDPMPLADV